jgi:hypothetical protein
LRSSRAAASRLVRVARGTARALPGAAAAVLRRCHTHTHRAGDEACISYGEDLSNAELRARYGFEVPGNPNGETRRKKLDPYA